MAKIISIFLYFNKNGYLISLYSHVTIKNFSQKKFIIPHQFHQQDYIIVSVGKLIHFLVFMK